MKTKTNRILMAAFIAWVAIIAIAATPSFVAFVNTQFATDNSTYVAIKSGATLTNTSLLGNPTAPTNNDVGRTSIFTWGDFQDNPATGGGIANVTNTFYVRTNGNNGTAVQGRFDLPWADPQTAQTALRAAAVAGNTNHLVLDVFGIYDLGNTSLWPTNNQTIKGYGTNATIIISTGDEHIQGPTIMAWDGVVVQDLTIVQRQVNGAPAPPNGALKDQTEFGALSDSPNSAFGGTATLLNVCLIGGAHGVQLNSAGSLPTIRMFNTVCYNSNAPVQTVAANCTIYANGFEWFNFGPEPRGRLFSCGIENTGGIMDLHNGVVHVQGFAAATQVFGLVSGGLTGSSMVAVATNILDNVMFDVTANGSSGTIADIITQPASLSVTNLMQWVSRRDGTALVILTNASGPFVPAGQIDAAEIRTGTITSNRIPAAVIPVAGTGISISVTGVTATISTNGTPFSGDGSAITNISPTNLTGPGTLPTNAFKYLPVLTDRNIVSNSTSELSLLDTNGLSGGFGASLVIPPAFWVAGANIFIHMEGYVQVGGGGNYTWGLRLVPTNVPVASGIQLASTGSSAVGAGNNTPFEYIAWLTYLGGNQVQVAGYFVKPNIAANVFATPTTVFTITNTVPYGLYPTVQFSVAATNNFVVTIGGGLYPGGP